MPTIKHLQLAILMVTLLPTLALGHSIPGETAGETHNEESKLDSGFSLGTAPRGEDARPIVKPETYAILGNTAPVKLRKARLGPEVPADVLNKLERMFKPKSDGTAESTQSGFGSSLLRQTAEEKKLQNR